jgi:hypothetical protein
MKHIKSYENNILKNDPKIGNYVLIYQKYFSNILFDFYLTEIGKIINIDEHEYPYLVRFENKLLILIIIIKYILKMKMNLL